MKRRFLILCISALCGVHAVAQYEYPFQDPDKTVEERADNIVSLLTLEEKIGQMMNNAPAIERLGIPAYNWWNECLHGVARSPYRVTSFPQAIGMAATWNTGSLQKMAEYASDEGRAIYNDASAKGKHGIYLGLTFWSPNVNIFRDPRWGRGQETYGEDPYLTSQLGMAFVRGLQGDDPHYLKASACAKHYAVHSGPEWNRSTFNAEVSNQDLWDTYLPAFQKLIVDAKVSGVMCAYNAFYGQPCCGNDVLMMDILRSKWGFTGYVTSDCGGINHFHKTHKTHPNAQTASADAVLHGTDCECSNNGAYQALNLAVAEGLITEEQINISLKRLFEIRLRLGMFDPMDRIPYSRITTDVLESQPHQEHALDMARQSIVLLKNENQLLPLSKKVKKIAVVGPNAVHENVMLGNYYGYPTKVWSIMDGLREKVGEEVELIYEPGCGYVDTQVFRSEFDSDKFSYKGRKGLQAEYFSNPRLEGAPVAVQMESEINFQHGDGEAFTSGIAANQMSIRYTTEFRPARSGEMSLYLSGDDGYKLYVDNELCIDSEKGQVYHTFSATKGKAYKVVIEYWQYTDLSELRFEVGNLWNADPKETARAVKDADVILFAGGISASLEGESMKVFAEGFKGGDRETISLPRVQTALLKELVATGKPVVLVMFTGSAIAVEWEAENLPAILNAWYPGQAGGLAIADVLFGDYNPAGRLPVTFYKSEKDLPDFEDYSMDNRTYRYFKGEVRYPFGYGLSYSKFNYNHLKVEKVTDGYRVSADVSNDGGVDGDEVVQLYVSSENASFRVPIRSLKGFQRIHLKKGETKNVSFSLPEKELQVIDKGGYSKPMEGVVRISVGGGQPIQGTSYQMITIGR